MSNNNGYCCTAKINSLTRDKHPSLISPFISANSSAAQRVRELTGRISPAHLPILRTNWQPLAFFFYNQCQPIPTNTNQYQPMPTTASHCQPLQESGPRPRDARVGAHRAWHGDDPTEHFPKVISHIKVTAAAAPLPASTAGVAKCSKSLGQFFFRRGQSSQQLFYTIHDTIFDTASAVGALGCCSSWNCCLLKLCLQTARPIHSFHSPPDTHFFFFGGGGLHITRCFFFPSAHLPSCATQRKATQKKSRATTPPSAQRFLGRRLPSPTPDSRFPTPPAFPPSRLLVAETATTLIKSSPFAGAWTVLQLSPAEGRLSVPRARPALVTEMVARSGRGAALSPTRAVPAVL